MTAFAFPSRIIGRKSNARQNDKTIRLMRDNPANQYGPSYPQTFLRACLSTACGYVQYELTQLYVYRAYASKGEYRSYFTDNGGFVGKHIWKF